jgi:hypothetical protein
MNDYVAIVHKAFQRGFVLHIQFTDVQLISMWKLHEVLVFFFFSDSVLRYFYLEALIQKSPDNLASHKA